MSGFIKYVENGGKNMSFKIEDDYVYVKYNQIWKKIKELLNVKFYSEPIYDDKYIKIKVKTFSSVSISCISIDSVLRVDQKKLLTVYLEKCKYRIKKRELTSFIDYEVDLSSDESDLSE